MTHALLVGLGGFVGSVLRYWLSGAVQRWAQESFPAGVLTVNLLGCFVIGAVMSLVEYRELFSPEWRIFLTIGVLGGFTTYSTFGYETFALLRDNQVFTAFSSVAAHILLGIAAVAAGWMMAKAIG